MASDILALLVRTNLALAAAVVLVMTLRRPVRALFGARAAYGLWLVAPLAIVAVLLPARVVMIASSPPTIAASTPPTPMPTPRPEPRPTPGFPTPTLLTDTLTEPFRPPRLGDTLVIIWGLIALLAIGAQAERQRRFLKSLGRLRGEDGLFHAQHAGVGPAVIGAFAPKVVLPADFTQRFTAEEQALILAHERTHLSTGDAQINALTTVLQCLFWFNPLVHLGANRLRVDQEIACDAAVLIRFPEARRAYGEAMLKTQLAPHAPPLGCHWPASANTQLKERFVMLKEHRHSRARRLAGGGAIAALALGASFAAWAAQPARVVQEARDDHRHALVQAIRQGDAAKVRALIAAGDVNDAANSKSPPLVLAAAAGRLETVKALIADGASVEATAQGDATPLISAVRSGNLAIVALLINNGADVDRAVPGEGTPLIAAARAGRADLVELLLNNGADANLAARGDGDPLINAVRSGDLKTVQLLINNGADTNRVATGDGTPLIAAAHAGRTDLVELLLNNGADANLAARGDGDPLMNAVRSGDLPTVRQLIKNGANVNQSVVGDGNPLITAAGSGRLDLVKVLVENGAAVESFVPGDETPLINAAQSGDLATVAYLVDKGADVNRAVPANRGETRSPLGEAAKRGHGSVVAYLKAKGARA